MGSNLLTMGCSGSRFDELPVVGHPSGLMVLPRCEMYLRPNHTVLKLREKLFSFSGDDCTVRDTDGVDWFKIQGSALSMTGQRTLTDNTGRIIAGYRKKLLSLHATAYITIEISGQTWVYATIKRQSLLSMSSADIFIHHPPLMLQDVTTDGIPPHIHVGMIQPMINIRYFCINNGLT